MSETTRGVLTEKQREYLRTPEEERSEKFSSQQRYRWRHQIRQRVTNAMFDFAVLTDHLSEDELNEIFDLEIHELDEDEELSDEQAQRVPAAALPQVIAFVARASDLDDAQLFPSFGRRQPALVTLFDVLDRGIQTWLAKQKHTLADVETDVEISNASPITDVVEEIQTGDEEATKQLPLRSFALLRSADLDPEERESVEEYEQERRAEMKKYSYGTFEPYPTNDSDDNDSV